MWLNPALEASTAPSTPLETDSGADDMTDGRWSERDPSLPPAGPIFTTQNSSAVRRSARISSAPPKPSAVDSAITTDSMDLSAPTAGPSSAGPSALPNVMSSNGPEYLVIDDDDDDQAAAGNARPAATTSLMAIAAAGFEDPFAHLR